MARGRLVAAAVLFVLGCASAGDEPAAVTGDAPTSPVNTTAAVIWPDNPTWTTVDVAGLVFDVQLAGPADGPPVVLLHGFPETGHQWRHQVEALVAAGYRTIAPNQRGYSPGARPSSVESYAMAELVGDVIGLADALGLEVFDLVGHDWGAGVAWSVAASHPARVSTLTALSVPHPSAYSEALRDPAGDQSTKIGYIDLFTTQGADLFLANDAAFLRGIWADAGAGPDDVRAYLEVLGEANAVEAALNWYRANELTAGRELASVTVPTLFVWSDGDCCLGRDAAELTGAHVSAPYRFEILEGVSHWIPEQAPDALAAHLLDFLEAPEGPG